MTSNVFFGKPQFKKFFWSLAIFSVLSFGLGYVAAAKRYSSFAENGKTESKILGEVKQVLDESFYSWNASTTLPTDKELEYGIVKGFVSAYNDPYTLFFPPVQSKAFQEEVTGSFGGVGMQVEKKGERIIVVTPLKDSPAMKAGVLAGDAVLFVDGIAVDGKSVEDVVAKIRGEIGTTVTIKLLRKEGEVYEVKIKRDQIKIPTIETEKRDGVFVVRLFNFSAESPELFEKAMDEFKEAGTQYLVLDLRSNPGGYLESAVKMASFFFPEGTVIVREGAKEASEDSSVNALRNFGGMLLNVSPSSRAESQVFRSLGFDYFNKNLRMVVLVDQGSASASEILAGALQDHGKAKVVGKTSFGKGSVQKLINLSDGSSLKVTVASWYTPKGNSISLNGIKPDIEADLDLERYKKDKKDDTQLLKAIEVVKSLK
jgi:carboxyl-terminal processing protease